MHLEPTENGFQIDAVTVGPLLGVPPEDVLRLMREGRIASLCEKGLGEDRGRHRITFRHGATRVRLTVNDAGEVLLRTRMTVAPRPGAQPLAGPGQPDKARREGGDTPADLTRGLETRFHTRLRPQLDHLEKLAEMVEDLHEGDEGVPAGLHHLLLQIGDVLEAHMQTAERVVFPALRSGATVALGAWIDTLRGDHDRLTRACAGIRAISQGFKLSDEACTSWATLYVRLAEFIDDLAEHMRLENALFSQFAPGGVAND